MAVVLCLGGRRSRRWQRAGGKRHAGVFGKWKLSVASGVGVVKAWNVVQGGRRREARAGLASSLHPLGRERATWRLAVWLDGSVGDHGGSLERG